MTEDRPPTAANGNNGLGALAAALAKAQAAFPKVLKDRTAKISSTKGEYSYKYSDLASLLEAVRPSLSANGLALTQPIEVTERGMVLHTMLLHVSGAHIDSYYPLAAHERPQEMGSEITYSRRYTAGSILGIASEDDDDGAAAQQAEPPTRAKYYRQGPKLAGPADQAGKPRPQEPVSDAQMASETAGAFDDSAVIEERKALRLKARKLAEEIGLSLEDQITAFRTYCGKGDWNTVEPAAAQDLIKWLETRAKQ